MERTYDTFVDNGLFILAHIIKKDIKDIEEKDIKNNLKLISDTILDFTGKEKYSNLKSMMLPNSPLTQTKSKKTLEEKLLEFIDLKGNEICVKCGKHKVSCENEINRAFLPNLSAHSFYNFSNNLQMINICGDCLTLGVLAILNCRVADSVMIFNSTEDKFMKNYTRKRYENYRRSDEKTKKEKKSRVKVLEEMIRYSETSKGHIEITNFNNTKDGGVFEKHNIESRVLKIYKQIQYEGLDTEFKEMRLFGDLVDNKIKYTYENKLVENGEIKCSGELLSFVMEEMLGMNKKLIETIKNIVDKLNDAEMLEVAYKNIRCVKNRNNFNNYLDELSDLYDKKVEDVLVGLDDIVKLTDYEIYKDVIRFIRVRIIEIKNK